MNRTYRPPHSITSAVLAGRLRTGEQMIETEPDPDKSEMLTDFWLELLRQYERQVDAERVQEARVSA